MTDQLNDNRRTGIDLELYVAEFYAKKLKDCRSQGKEFTLTLTQFKKLINTKKCFYSGTSLTHSGVGTIKTAADPLRFTDLTLERVDCNIGYVDGNVKAVSSGFNKMKSVFENPNNPVTFADLYKFADTLRKLGVK